MNYNETNSRKRFPKRCLGYPMHQHQARWSCALDTSSFREIKSGDSGCRCPNWWALNSSSKSPDSKQRSTTFKLSEGTCFQIGCLVFKRKRLRPFSTATSTSLLLRYPTSWKTSMREATFFQKTSKALSTRWGGGIRSRIQGGLTRKMESKK